MSGSSNGSNPRSPRPVAALRRHAALLVAAGALLVGLLVSTGIALDDSAAEGRPPSVAVHLADLADGTTTDVLGERAAELLALFDEVAAEQRRVESARRARPVRVVTPDDPTVWDDLAHCETGGNWAMDHVPGFAGGLGFANGTWASYGGGEFADSAADASREQQIEIAQRVLERQGWGAWPGCSSRLGLR